MKKITLITLFALGLLLLAACNPAPDPKEILIRSAENNSNAQTFEASMYGEISFSGETLEIGATVLLDRPNLKILLELTKLEIPAALMGDSAQNAVMLQQMQGFKMLVSGQKVYFKIAALGNKWVDFDTLNSGQSIPVGQMFLNPKISREAAEATVKPYIDLEYKGLESLYGVNCHHITSGYDAQELIATLETLAGSQIPIDDKTLILLKNIEIKMEQWIGAEDYLLRKAIVTATLPVPEKTELIFTVEYPSINQPVVIDDPRNSSQ